VLTGGITPNNVLINYVGVLPVSLGPGSSVQGIVLAPRAAFGLNGVSLTPELIAQSISLGGGGTETGYVSDDFNRPDGPVGAGWQDFAEEAMAVSSNELVDPSGVSFAGGYWRTTSFTADHYSQAQIPPDNGADVQAVLVRASGDSTTNRQYYQVYWDSSGKLQAGFFADNATYPGGFYRDIGSPVTHAKNAGDVLRLEIDGSTLSVYVNGALQSSNADAELTSGSPGILVHGSAKFENWQGGNLP